MRGVLFILAALLTGCGVLSPPASPLRAWGIPYRAEVVPAGSLDPFDGYTVAYRVRVEAPYATDVFLLAHELAHVWQWHHRALLLDWRGVPCAVQVASHCTPREAHADAVALAVVAAGCGAGDLGWHGGTMTGCTLPDPADIKP